MAAKKEGFAISVSDPSKSQYYEYDTGQEADVILHAACKLGVSASDIRLMVVSKVLNLTINVTNLSSNTEKDCTESVDDWASEHASSAIEQEMDERTGV